MTKIQILKTSFGFGILNFIIIYVLVRHTVWRIMIYDLVKQSEVIDG